MDIDDFGEPQIHQGYIPSWYAQQIKPDKFYVETLKGFVEVKEEPIKEEGQ